MKTNFKNEPSNNSQVKDKMKEIIEEFFKYVKSSLKCISKMLIKMYYICKNPIYFSPQINKME